MPPNNKFVQNLNSFKNYNWSICNDNINQEVDSKIRYQICILSTIVFRGWPMFYSFQVHKNLHLYSCCFWLYVVNFKKYYPCVTVTDLIFLTIFLIYHVMISIVKLYCSQPICHNIMSQGGHYDPHDTSVSF
jgi:hypothetical protein